MKRTLTKALSLLLFLAFCIPALAQKPFKGTIGVTITLNGVENDEDEYTAEVRMVVDDSKLTLDKMNVYTDEGESDYTEALADAKVIFDKGAGKGTVAFMQTEDQSKVAAIVNLPYTFNALVANASVKAQINKVLNYPLEKDIAKLKNGLNLKVTKGANETINGLVCKTFTIAGDHVSMKYYTSSAVNLDFVVYASAFGAMGTQLSALQKGFFDDISTLSPEIAKEMKAGVPVRFEISTDDGTELANAIKKAYGKPVTGGDQWELPSSLSISFNYTTMATIDPLIYDVEEFTAIIMNNEEVDKQLANMLPATAEATPAPAPTKKTAPAKKSTAPAKKPAAKPARKK